MPDPARTPISPRPLRDLRPDALPAYPAWDELFEPVEARPGSEAR